MDIVSFVIGVASSLVATAIWAYGVRKRRGYIGRKVSELEYEKERIKTFAVKPAELYRESLAGIFYLFLIVAFANVARLLHGLMYDGGVVWQQVFIEGGLWCVIGSLAVQYKKRIDGVYDVDQTVQKLDAEIARVKHGDDAS